MIELLTTWLPTLIALLIAGAFAGLLAGLLGVGGGLIIVPTLFTVFQSTGVAPDAAMVMATGTSLLTIVPTSISSALAHHKKGNVDLDILKSWLAPMVVGVVCGTLLAKRLDGLSLSFIFGMVAILMALNMILRANAPPLVEQLPAYPIQAFAAGSIGLVSVMMGIGAGTLGVTTLNAMNCRAHRAVGTAAAFGLVIALPGALLVMFNAQTPEGAPLGTVGWANLPGFLVIVSMTTLVAPLGARLANRLADATLKRVFAFFLILVGCRMLWQGLPHLLTLV